MTLQTNFYFLSPVEVVRVTPKNLEDVAEWCGGKVAETESRRVEGRMDKYVWVPTPKGSAISWAFPGMFITKRVVITEKDEIKVTYSVFRKDYFNKNYFKDHLEALDKTWERQSRENRGDQALKALIHLNGKKLDTAAITEQVKEQLPSGTGPTVVNVYLPETTPNGEASMIAQREAIRESAVEQAAAGAPDRP